MMGLLKHQAASSSHAKKKASTKPKSTRDPFRIPQSGNVLHHGQKFDLTTIRPESYSVTDPKVLRFSKLINVLTMFSLKYIFISVKFC